MTINIKVKKAKEKLQEIARKTAKDIGHEIGEIPKKAPSQLLGKDNSSNTDVGNDEPKSSPVVEAMMQKTKDTGDGESSKEEVRKFIKDKEKVEDDIEKYQRKREELEKEWEHSQEKVNEDVNLEPGQPLEIPSSKPSRGKFHPGKQKSPEKRLGKK